MIRRLIVVCSVALLFLGYIVWVVWFDNVQVHKEAQPQREKDPSVIATWIHKKNPSLSVSDVATIIESSIAASQKFFVDPLLLLAIIQQESSFRPTVRSGYGAVGLMQVVPRFHADKFDGAQYDDIAANINAGAWVLRDCQKKHDHNLHKALSCYSGYNQHTVISYKTRVLGYRADILNSINQER